MPGTTLTNVSHISHFKSRRNPEGPLFFNPDFSLMETEAERGPCIQRYNTKTEQSSDVNSSLPDLKYVLNYCLLPNNLSLIPVPFLVSCGFCICNRPNVRGIFLSILLVFVFTEHTQPKSKGEEAQGDRRKPALKISLHVGDWEQVEKVVYKE